MRPVVSSRAVLQWCEARSRAPAFVDHRPVIVADRHLTAQGKKICRAKYLRKGDFWYPTHPAFWFIQYPVPCWPSGPVLQPRQSSRHSPPAEMEEIEFGRAVPGQASGKRLGRVWRPVSGPKKEEESPDPSPKPCVVISVHCGTG
jgi:hypothetical protein